MKEIKENAIGLSFKGKQRWTNLVFPAFTIAAFVALLVRIEISQRRNEALFSSLESKIKDLQDEKLNKGKVTKIETIREFKVHL